MCTAIWCFQVSRAAVEGYTGEGEEQNTINRVSIQTCMSVAKAADHSSVVT